MQSAALPSVPAELLFVVISKQEKSLFFKIGLLGVRSCTPYLLCRCSADGVKVMQQPLVLVILPNFRARSISVLQEQLLFEGKKMILGLADARGVPGGKASRWCSRMESRQDASGCHRVSGTRSWHPVLCLNHTGEIHGSFPSQGRNCPVESQQKITAKFNHFLPVSLDFLKLGPSFWW